MPETSSTKRSTPFNIHEYVATFFLPDSMLDYFDIVWAEELKGRRLVLLR